MMDQPPCKLWSLQCNFGKEGNQWTHCIIWSNHHIWITWNGPCKLCFSCSTRWKSQIATLTQASGSMSLWSLPVPSCHYIWTIHWWIVQSSTLNSHLAMVSLHLEIVAKALVMRINHGWVAFKPCHVLEWGHYWNEAIMKNKVNHLFLQSICPMSTKGFFWLIDTNKNREICPLDDGDTIARVTSCTQWCSQHLSILCSSGISKAWALGHGWELPSLPDWELWAVCLVCW
jgi:hypothetical protein